jgi:methionine-rich copper-binding protein CopC
MLARAIRSVARARLAVGIVGVAMLGVASGSSPALAHAIPVRFEPRRDAVLLAMPVEVRITFDGDIEPALSTIQVVDSTGQRVDKGDVRLDAHNPRVLRVGLAALRSGTYQVRWQIWAIDGHRTEGVYVFTLKSPM